ncbi:SDR family oxidoreductase [Streptomyces anulatus]
MIRPRRSRRRVRPAVHRQREGAVLPHAAGLDRLRDGGRVLTIATGLSHAAMMPDLIAHAMSKGALDMFTRYLSEVPGSRGITVSAVAPGIVDTDFNADRLRASDAARADATSLSALGKAGALADIADVAALLASDAGRWSRATGSTRRAGHWPRAHGERSP